MKKTFLLLACCLFSVTALFSQITNSPNGAWTAWQGTTAPPAGWQTNCGLANFGNPVLATHNRWQENQLNPVYGIAPTGFPGSNQQGVTTNYIWGPNPINVNNRTTAYFQLCFNINNLNGCDMFTFTGNADDSLTLWVNGNNAGAISGWSNTITVDITPFLNCGQNVVAVQANELSGNGTPQFFIGNVTQTAGSPPPVSLSAKTDCATHVLQLCTKQASATNTYSWTGPGGFTSNLPCPIISPADNSNDGWYSLTVTDPTLPCCSTTAWIYVDVPEDCCDEIDFNTDFEIEQSCLDIEVTDLSTVTGGTISAPVFWIFQAGATPVLALPGATVQHTYASPGTYEVCLVIQVFPNDSTCCHDTLCKTITVSEGCDGIPDPTFSFANPVPCTVGSNCCVGTIFSDQVLFDPSQVIWDWGDGSFSLGVAPSFGGWHQYTSSGWKTITMKVTYHPPCNPELCCQKIVERRIYVDCGDIKDDPKEDGRDDGKDGPMKNGSNDESLISELNAYPNPIRSGTQLTLEIPDDQMVNTVFMYNMLGEEVTQLTVRGLQKAQLEIPQNIPDGLYIIRTDNRQISPLKVFVQD